MSPEKRSILLIDGSNFYFKLKDQGLHNLLNIDFSSLATFLSRDSKVEAATYYVGKIRTDGSEKTKKMQANQQKLFEHLKKHKFKYSLGYLLKSDGKMHEKGVDVNMAVDILIATYENQCDRIILVSSDTDLLPAVKQAKRKGKEVEYVGFSHMPSFAMVTNCTESRILTKEDFAPFINH